MAFQQHSGILVLIFGQDRWLLSDKQVGDQLVCFQQQTQEPDKFSKCGDNVWG